MTKNEFSEKFSEFMGNVGEQSLCIGPYSREGVNDGKLYAMVTTEEDCIRDFVKKNTIFKCNWNVEGYGNELVLTIVKKTPDMKKVWEGRVIYKDGIVISLQDDCCLWAFDDDSVECLFGKRYDKEEEEEVSEKKISEVSKNKEVAKDNALIRDYFGNDEANKFYQEFCEAEGSSKSFSYSIGSDGKLHMKKNIDGSVKELVINTTDKDTADTKYMV